MDVLIPTQTQEGNSNPNTTLGNTKRIESGSPSEKRSQSVRKEKDFSPNFISYQAQVHLAENNRQVVLTKILIMFNTEDDPKKCVEVMASRDLAF